MGWALRRPPQGKDLIYAGKVDHGFTKTSAADLRDRLAPLVRKTQPYSKRIADKGILVEAKLVAEIEYRAKPAEGSPGSYRRDRLRARALLISDTATTADQNAKPATPTKNQVASDIVQPLASVTNRDVPGSKETVQLPPPRWGHFCRWGNGGSQCRLDNADQCHLFPAHLTAACSAARKTLILMQFFRRGRHCSKIRPLTSQQSTTTVRCR
jgi:hypothetical protein